jgi:hypothetical protein
MKRLMLLTFALCPLLAAQPQCTTNLVRGTYAVSYDGWALMPQAGSPMPVVAPGVILGVVSIDHDGNLSGGETVIIAGQLVEYEITGGKLTIQSDCTGSMRLLIRPKGTGGPSAPVVERFVALVSGQDTEIRTTILSMEGSPVGAMSLGIWKRMSPTAGAANW